MSTQGKGFAIENKSAPDIKISISGLTGNFLIVCGKSDFCIDSASLRSDARLVKRSVVELLKKYPIESYTEDNWLEWMKLHHEKIPNVDAVTFMVAAGGIRRVLMSELDPSYDSRR